MFYADLFVHNGYGKLRKKFTPHNRAPKERLTRLGASTEDATISAPPTLSADLSTEARRTYYIIIERESFSDFRIKITKDGSWNRNNSNTDLTG